LSKEILTAEKPKNDRTPTNTQRQYRSTQYTPDQSKMTKRSIASIDREINEAERLGRILRKLDGRKTAYINQLFFIA
jgi:hypothetical protein